MLLSDEMNERAQLSAVGSFKQSGPFPNKKLE
jgi:hypothetical protein